MFRNGQLRIGSPGRTRTYNPQVNCTETTRLFPIWEMLSPISSLGQKKVGSPVWARTYNPLLNSTFNLRELLSPATTPLAFLLVHS